MILRILLTLALCLPALPVQADYDPEAGTLRLIEQAEKERAEIRESLERLRRARERLRQDFLTLNGVEQELGGHLRRIRMIDARNKAMLTISTGLNITAVNGPEKLLEAGVGIAVDVGSEYLRNNFPGLADTSVTVELPRLGGDSVAAVRRFNETLALDDRGVERRIFAEDPKFAEEVANRGWLQKTLSGDKLTDELVALKKAQFLIRDGTAAESALGRQKAALLEQQRKILHTIQELEQRERGAEETIRSWNRTLGQNRLLKEASQVPKVEPVSWAGDTPLDFSSAAGKMREALASLKGNKIDCNGYHTLVSSARYGAERYYNERIQAACRNNWGSASCNAAIAALGQAWVSQIEGTQKALAADFKTTREGPAADFRSKHKTWYGTEVAIPTDYWDKKWREVAAGPYNGMDLANNIFGLTLGISPRVAENWFVPNAFGLTLDALRYPNYSNLSQAEMLLERAQNWSRDLAFQKQMADASNRTGQRLAAEAGDLSKSLEPHRHYWGCVLGDDLVSTWVHLRRFAASYPDAAAAGEERAGKIMEWIAKEQSKGSQVVGLLGVERGILEQMAAADEVMRRLHDSARAAGGALDMGLDPYPLWSQLKGYGIGDAAVKEIEAALPKLKNVEFAIAFHLDHGGSQMSFGPNSKTIHEPEFLDAFRKRLTDMGTARIADQGEYRDLYHQAKRIQDRLDGQIGSLRQALAGIVGHDAGPGTPKLFYGERYLVPNDLPDPTLGVFEQFDRYAKVAREYHAILQPMQPWTFPLYGDLKKLKEKVFEEGTGQAAGNDFYSWHHKQMSELLRLQKVVSWDGRRQIDPKAPFGAMVREVMNRLHDLASQVSERQRIARIGDELARLVQGARDFLARPDAQGGAATGRDWLGSLAAPLREGSEAQSLRAASRIASLLQQAAGLRQQIEAWLARGGEESVRKLYADFVAAYQNRELARLTRLMAPGWKAADGSDLGDLEDILSNSFRVFDRIRVELGGMNIHPIGDGRFSVGYSISISGEIFSSGLKHQETSQVEDIVEVGPDGAHIASTRGGQLWLR